MPIIRVQVPAGVFDEDATERLIAELNEASADAEQMPKDPEYRMGLIIIWEQLPSGAIRSNGTDPTSMVVPVFLWFYPPQGVLDDEHAADYVARVQPSRRSPRDAGASAGRSITCRTSPSAPAIDICSTSSTHDGAHAWGYSPRKRGPTPEG